MTETVVLITAIFLGSQLLLYAYRELALRRHWLDIPNERSSHSAPTPGGAGLCLAVVFLLASAYLFVAGVLSSEIMWLCGLSLIMAMTGWFDDRYCLSRRIRAVIYLVAAVLFVNGVTEHVAAWWLIALALLIFAFVNAFNFMDGIDGIAASQVLFYAVAFLFMSTGTINADFQLVLFFVATLAAAFLLWNWSPARLFLGDSGSLFFGFLLAAISVFADELSVLSLFSSAILLATFVADSSVTMLCRLLNGERIQDAHRSHLYQLLAKHWGSHARVVILYAAVNITVLLPVALISEAQASWATILFVATYAILCAIVCFYRTRLLSSMIEKI